MTATLASYIDDLDLPAEPGVSTRAARAVLRMMAKIADSAGQFRYGLRGSKLATLTEYSLSVVRRAQRYLVDHGFIERVQVGGGRASTRWRILLHKLRPDPALEHSSDVPAAQQPERHDTAQEHTPKLFHWINPGSGGQRSTIPDRWHRCPLATDPPTYLRSLDSAKAGSGKRRGASGARLRRVSP